LRQCQRDCLDACAKGARVVEMACGTGKTQVIKELVSNVSGRVLRALDSGVVLNHALSFSPSSGGL
jgi:superfamily II DNA or RNA helicase